MRPAAVLIEGPSDYNADFGELLLDTSCQSRSTAISRRGSGAYYSVLRVFAQEWSAARGPTTGIRTRFIDLPWAEVADLEPVDAPLCRRRAAARALRPQLCDRLGVEDFDDLWDKLIEARGAAGLDDYLRRVHCSAGTPAVWEGRS